MLTKSVSLGLRLPVVTCLAIITMTITLQIVLDENRFAESGECCLYRLCQGPPSQFAVAKESHSLTSLSLPNSPSSSTSSSSSSRSYNSSSTPTSSSLLSKPSEQFYLVKQILALADCPSKPTNLADDTTLRLRRAQLIYSALRGLTH